MELDFDAIRRATNVVEPTRTELAGTVAMILQAVPETTVYAGTRLRGLEILRRGEIVPALVRPA